MQCQIQGFNFQGKQELIKKKNIYIYIYIYIVGFADPWWSVIHCQPVREINLGL